MARYKNNSGSFISCKVFKNLGKYEKWMKSARLSQHMFFERRERMIAANFSNTHQFAVAAFEVNRGHPDGPEIHFITNMGVIVIFNKYSHKICSILIARPNQVKRYFDDCGIKISREIWRVVRIAGKHNRQGLNMI